MRVYRLLMRLLPRAFREEFGADLEADAADVLAAERSRGRWPLVRAWLGLVGDAARQGLSARRPVRAASPPFSGVLAMDHLRQDLRHAIRSLVSRPGFTLVVLVLMAIGIGANAAIFSIVDATLLRPLPYHDPDRLVLLWESYAPMQLETMPWSAEDYADVQQRARLVGAMSLLHSHKFVLTGRGTPVRLEAGAVEPSLFPLLGVDAALGRTFRADEGQAGHEHVALLTHATWQTRFGGMPDIAGQSIVLDGVPYDIVGVLPSGATFPPPITFTGEMIAMEPDVFVPLVWTAGAVRGNHTYFAIGRLAPGATSAAASAELDGIARVLERDHPDSNTGVHMHVVPLHGQSVVTIRAVLVMMLVAVGGVLLIACASIANLLLARGSARGREMAVRAALGAGRARLARQLGVEHLVLGLAGGAAGLLVARVMSAALLAANPIELPAMFSSRLDGPVLLFAAAATLFAVAAFGVVPALQASRVDLAGVLKTGGRGATPAMSGTKHALVVGQVALALVLLTAAGLTIRSLTRLWDVNPGFHPEHVFAVPVSLPATTSGSPAAERQFQDRVVRRVNALPGVSHTALVTMLPFTLDKQSSDYDVDGQPPRPPGQEFIAAYDRVSQDFFVALGIPLIEGRAFRDGDDSGSTPVAIVSEALARRHWPAGQAVGRRLITGDASGTGHDVRTIVGVVADVRAHGFAVPVEATIYEPLSQMPAPAYWLVGNSARPADALSSEIRGAVASLDSTMPVAGTRLMTDIMGDTVKKPRFTALMLSAFGAVSLLIAAVGLYGVLAFDVVQHLRDFGVRLALGATPADVRRIVLGRSLRLVGLGAAIGVAGAFALSRWMAGLLFGTSPTDALTFVTAGVVVAAAAGLAAWLPARRAARADPMATLRAE